MTWEQAWAEGRTPWDAGASPPALHSLCAGELSVAGEPLPRGRALVPGCGAGHDVLTLAASGRETTGVDLAPDAARRFEELRATREVSQTAACVQVLDFFNWRPADPFDLAWDYTFFCAIPPALRPDWANQLAACLRPGAELWTLMFPLVAEPPEDPRGPPYPVHLSLYAAVLEPAGFELLGAAPVPRSHPGREGREQLARWHRR